MQVACVHVSPLTVYRAIPVPPLHIDGLRQIEERDSCSLYSNVEKHVAGRLSMDDRPEFQACLEDARVVSECIYCG
jgi:hypothetical protein